MALWSPRMLHRLLDVSDSLQSTLSGQMPLLPRVVADFMVCNGIGERGQEQGRSHVSCNMSTCAVTLSFEEGLNSARC